MFSVGQSDVINALKKFRRLAKQDFLASTQTSDPVFWRLQAEARRDQYEELMESVRVDGVESAYRRSTSQYTALPLSRGENQDPDILGREQAFEMFFQALGVDEKSRTRLRNARRRVPLAKSVKALEPKDTLSVRSTTSATI